MPEISRSDPHAKFAKGMGPATVDRPPVPGKNGPGMETSNLPPIPVEPGATAVITHRVRAVHDEDYNQWLKEISPVSRSFPGYLDLHLIRPIPGLTCTYTIVVRFDTEEHLSGWMYSPERQRLIAKARPFLARDDDFFVCSGLDFWFTPEGAKTQVPVRWKQFLVTWSAIFPLVLAVSFILPGVFDALHLPNHAVSKTLVATGVVVFSMTYLVMPAYTRLLKRWLFR